MDPLRQQKRKEKEWQNFINVTLFIINHVFLENSSEKIFYRNLLHILRLLIFDHCWLLMVHPFLFSDSPKTEVHNGFDRTPYCYWSWFFQAFIVNRHLLHHFLISPRFCYCVLLRWLTYHIKQAQLQLRY